MTSPTSAAPHAGPELFRQAEALRAGGDEGAAVGERLHRLAARLYPIPRSLTGDGVRETLAVLGETLPLAAPPLTLHEVPSGSPVLDWRVPPEWNVSEAWIAGPDGRRVVDFRDHSLHLLGYSAPVDASFTREELDEHLFSLPEQPDLIPYRTSYYRETWGFCLPHRLRESLPAGTYRVKIDSRLDPAGSLTYGELLLPGEAAAETKGGGGEMLITCHVCHPSLANDNLSGIAVTAELARRLSELPGRRLAYRFLWIPGTIGSIAWLDGHPEVRKGGAEHGRVRGGLVAANLGDGGRLHYKRSRRGDAEIDRAVEHVLAGRVEIEDFSPFGYDERQFCSPGFDLPMGSLTRTPWGRYPEYHTSADDLSLLSASSLAGSLAAYLEVAAALEVNRRYRNLEPYGEPQLGPRGLYGSIGGAGVAESQLALLWVLNLADGEHDLLATAESSGLPLRRLAEAARALLDAGLLEPC